MVSGIAYLMYYRFFNTGAGVLLRQSRLIHSNALLGAF